MLHHREFVKLLSVSTTAATLTAAIALNHDDEEKKMVYYSFAKNKNYNKYIRYPNGLGITYCEVVAPNQPPGGTPLYKAASSEAQQEHKNSPTTYKQISKMQSMLYKWHMLGLNSLPTPRILSPIDPIFTYHKMRQGLKQREKDELKLRELQNEISYLVQRQQEKNNSNADGMNAGNEERMVMMKGIMERISEIAYGKGITPQMREDFLVVSSRCVVYSSEQQF